MHFRSLTTYISFKDVSRSFRNTNTFYVKNTSTNYGIHTPVSRCAGYEEVRFLLFILWRLNVVLYKGHVYNNMASITVL